MDRDRSKSERKEIAKIKKLNTKIRSRSQSIILAEVIRQIIKIDNTMNWLAHILLSEPSVENRLGNLLGDLAKGKEIEKLSYNLRQGIARHYAIDKFTDTHAIIRSSKRRVDQDYSRFSGILIDVFYDHFLARNWKLYSTDNLSDFTAKIYNSFQSYQGEIPQSARQIIQQMIDEDWLTSYQSFEGIENALKRIDNRIKSRMGNQISLVSAVTILKKEYTNFEQDFHSFFPELQNYMQDYDFLMQKLI